MNLERRFRAPGGQFCQWRPWQEVEGSHISDLFKTGTLQEVRFTADDGSVVEYRKVQQ